MSGTYAPHAQSPAVDGRCACGSSPGEEYCPDRQVSADKKRIWRFVKRPLKDFFCNLPEFPEHHQTHHHAIFRTNETPGTCSEKCCPDRQVSADKKRIWRFVKRPLKDFFCNLPEFPEHHETHHHAIFRTNETPGAPTFARSIEQAPEAKNLYLRFSMSNTPVYNSEHFYSEDRVRNEDGSALQVELVDIKTGQLVEDGAVSSARFKILVLKGDFESDNDGDSWPPATSSLTKSIVKPRDGKKKLLAGGDLIVTLKGGKGNLSTELHFTDNSSWIRGRKFRLALQLLPGCSFDGLHIREAITEPFAVKDKRGKPNMKRKAPSNNDPVCRLHGIANGLSKCLNENGIYTVADFLRASEKDPEKLQNVILNKMPEKKFKAALEMARKSRDQLMGAPAVARSTSAIQGAADQPKVALGSVENEGSEHLVNIQSNSPHEDSFLNPVTASAACGSDDIPQPWQPFPNQLGTTTSYSLPSASNLAAATTEGAYLNDAYTSYSTYTGNTPFPNQLGTTTSYSLPSASNLAAATTEGAYLNDAYTSYSTYTGNTPFPIGNHHQLLSAERFQPRSRNH
ncbi:hypothetical protein CY35_03G029500 [Sphagnum magellanicum]|nr:hypothetical protein CY35_03G029500 [Sphagnum magellanicum]